MSQVHYLMPQVRPRNTSVVLGNHFAEFVDSQVESGRYGSASDVMRAGLRLLEEHEAKVRALEAALVEGETSGDPLPFDFEEFTARKRAEHKAKHALHAAGE
jgi:antitoxin ParD1/3/4